MANIEIVGVDKFRFALGSLPGECRPVVCRQVANKPAQYAAAEARRMQPIGSTGKTARTIGILRVRNAQQPYVEVNYKGRSLGHIYTSGTTITRSGRGSVKGFPNIFHRAGDNVRGKAQREMKVDMTNILVRALKKYGYSPK
eukprot:GHVR01162162.1.p1 GENE.GHVR01162162.1~~GHVR01162162.1.p1  ORF type:complete len:142 (-),score=10.42 GHVR01162162.1:180-605(-)